MNSSTDDTASGYPAAINGWLDEKVGNTFTGTLVGYDQAPSRFGKDVVIATFVDDKEKQHALWLSATVLVSQFARIKPEPGEKVTVTYLGTKGENSYKNYTVDCPDRPPFVPDWAALSDDVEDEGKDRGAA